MAGRLRHGGANAPPLNIFKEGGRSLEATPRRRRAGGLAWKALEALGRFWKPSAVLMSAIGGRPNAAGFSVFRAARKT